VNESMACGRPVIVSDKVGCAADLVKPNETGEVFTHSSLAGLRETLARFVKLRDRTSVMGETARELIATWSIPAYCAAVEDAVADVTKTHSFEPLTHLPS
ncbi:MAG: glycosyltransferase, partial [Gemmatimonadaceae bacterium]